MAGSGASSGGGPLSAASGPQNWAFMPTGLTTTFTIAATSITLTLSQFVTTAINPPQVQFYGTGAANPNSAIFVTFGTGETISPTVGVPIVPKNLITPLTGVGDSPFQMLSTGSNNSRSPNNVVVIGGAGTCTWFITPGEGSR